MGAHAPLFKPFERSGLATFPLRTKLTQGFCWYNKLLLQRVFSERRRWKYYGYSTWAAKFFSVPAIHFLLSKIYDGRCSTETFLKTATLSVLVWAYPRKMKTRNGNFKNAAILPRQCYYGNIVAPIPLHAYMFSCDTSMRTHFATVFL